ncbi:hypothetical protein, conserved [Plasmodium gonderi]|uniref:Uncharacterized protein n=1 Tax=Plasmodium gonderi TaxID=77519 RepID=A0A1Y1JJ50_PLAGO|nr:hypothetical protein, conserved [Plasmodium gonderi]GAW81405.1 hypothetical protein, conserved [Plasmodium gonderi]
MVLMRTLLNDPEYVSKERIEKETLFCHNIKTVDEKYITCEINKKKKQWTDRKLQKEFSLQNHDLVCLNKYRYHPLKDVCQGAFSFLQDGESYYTSSYKLQNRDYGLIFRNLCTSPSIQISFCGIMITIIAALVDLKNRR